MPSTTYRELREAHCRSGGGVLPTDGATYGRSPECVCGGSRCRVVSFFVPRERRVRKEQMVCCYILCLGCGFIEYINDEHTLWPITGSGAWVDGSDGSGSCES